MSAWIVSSGHIDVLVHALAQYEVVSRDLMDALHTAVLERHSELGERVKGGFGETFRYTTLPAWDSAPWGIEVLEDVVPARA